MMIKKYYQLLNKNICIWNSEKKEIKCNNIKNGTKMFNFDYITKKHKIT